MARKSHTAKAVRDASEPAAPTMIGLWPESSAVFPGREFASHPSGVARDQGAMRASSEPTFGYLALGVRVSRVLANNDRNAGRSKWTPSRSAKGWNLATKVQVS